jgi:chromosome segregation ATPase
MSRIPANLQEKWSFIQAKRYSDQCIWMMNGFWDQMQNDAESIWQWSAKFSELDPERKSDGTDLDEFWSHKFLESLGQTMTVIEMREKFRQIDADFNKKMSMIEYLMYRYKLKVLDVINAPQGDNQAQIQEAQTKVATAQSAVDEVLRLLEEQRAAADVAAKADAEASRTAAAAKAAAEEADAVAAPYRAAVAENDAALKELQAQEKAYSDKKATLEAAKADTSLGVVKRNKASNELDQLLAEDPLPLRKAKINQTATLKKMEKSAAPFNEASAKANAAKQEAEAAAAAARAGREAAEAAARETEAAKAEAEAKLQEAMDFLQEAKSKGSVAHGAIWWLERSVIEKRKYMPAGKK